MLPTVLFKQNLLYFQEKVVEFLLAGREDITYLEHWMKRVAINFHSQSMGVYLLEDKERIHNEIYNY